ncbi:hypothetical protein SB822_39125, partial [Paraburkholderia sp. SIMBA_054]
GEKVEFDEDTDDGMTGRIRAATAAASHDGEKVEFDEDTDDGMTGRIRAATAAAIAASAEMGDKV